VEHIIGKLSQIPLGEGRNFEVGDLRIAVFHTRDGGVFATRCGGLREAGRLF
jgi:nitrite reductase (NADH) small subunit